jgi:hypothetical protein
MQRNFCETLFVSFIADTLLISVQSQSIKEKTLKKIIYFHLLYINLIAVL